MTYKLFVLFVASAILGCGTPAKNSKVNIAIQNIPENKASIYAKTITQNELKTLLYAYASDEFEGRETGQKGQKLAVNFLKSQYIGMNIPSPLGNDNYFQEVPLEIKKLPKSQMFLDGIAFSNAEDMVVLGVSESQTFIENNLVFVGYGVNDKSFSDYKNIDVRGKIVLAKTGEPMDESGNYIVSGTNEKSLWSDGETALYKKSIAAVAHGAKALLFWDNNLFAEYAKRHKKQNYGTSSSILSLKTSDFNLPTLLISEDLAKAIYSNISEVSIPNVLSADINLSMDYTSEQVNSENVVAFIEGSEKPEEIIVLSAHLDHEGMKNGDIYNGADDDGSGTVALLEIAEAFKMAQQAGHGPKRSLLFLHVTGEEKGLLGSKHYTDNDPLFPLENTVANLNIDMIGRTDPKRDGDERNYIYLIGSDKLSTELHDISEAVAKQFTSITLDYKYNEASDPNRFYYRSDHYNFAKNNVPVIFYFNGTHNDYHQPTDTADKIEYDLLENRTRLVFYTAWEIANRKDRILVDKAL